MILSMWSDWKRTIQSLYLLIDTHWCQHLNNSLPSVMFLAISLQCKPFRKVMLTRWLLLQILLDRIPTQRLTTSNTFSTLDSVSKCPHEFSFTVTPSSSPGLLTTPNTSELYIAQSTSDVATMPKSHEQLELTPKPSLEVKMSPK